LSINQKTIKNKFMRNEFINMFAELNATTLENLTREVKESVAVETHEENTKQVFTAANLWDIHNRRRVREPRRSFAS
jgi:16S rRNA G966 N2-methylase RsmD